MRIQLLSLLTVALLGTTFQTDAQEKRCLTMNHLNKHLAQDPSLLKRMEVTEQATQKWIAAQKARKAVASTYTIPVVVHVIYNTEIENVSDAQISSQMAVLNQDFRKLNSDTLASTHPFAAAAGDATIEFCLANVDPSGAPTTGITRTKTDVTSWADSILDNIKSTANGGYDNWDPTKYLNLYVVNLDGGTLGFASFPDELTNQPSLDGVVIRYEAFGTIGTAGTGGFDVNKGGRTATHEVGHWLNLRHIWGDETCGSDSVDDTKPAKDANYHCPTFPHNANNGCGTDANGEMYMDYMDYVDDNCMAMFTKGQVDRMHAALNGPRSGLLTSKVCPTGPTSIGELFDDRAFDVFPNPSNGNFTIKANDVVKHVNITVMNVLGERIKSIDLVGFTTTDLNLNEYNNGVYFVKITSGNKTISKKVFVTK